MNFNRFVVALWFGLTAASTPKFIETFGGAEPDGLVELENRGWTFQSRGLGNIANNADLSQRLGGFYCINRGDRNGQSYLQRTFANLTGSFKFSAYIRAEKIVSGNRWKGGQFQAVVKKDGKEIAWPSEQFEGSFEWQSISFVAHDLQPAQQILLRIGLQEGKGKVCFDQIVVESVD